MNLNAGLFPGLRDVAYLDSASAGILAAPTLAAMSSVLEEHAALGSSAAAKWQADLPTHRSTIAELVGGRPANLAFTQNTSTGLAIVANGVDWHPGDNIVVPAGEFPSNRYPWTNLRGRGVEVRSVPAPNGYASVDSIRDAVDAKTRILAISAVQFSSGYRYDLAAIGKIRRNALLVVDGAQSVGALKSDVAADDIDILSASAHKWMLGPLGIGFVHLSDRAMSQLAPSTPGWRSVTDPYAFDPELKAADDARRFESGTENVVGIAGMARAAAMIHAIGVDAVHDAVLQRSGELTSRIIAAGFRTAYDFNEHHRSGIVLIPSADPTALRQRLLDQGVVCSARPAGVRLAPHFFTSTDDLDRVGRALTATASP